MEDEQFTLAAQGLDETTHDEYQEVDEDGYPVEELIPNSVRYGLDPQTLSKPVDAAIYGYDIGQMKERPWARPGADKSDYFNYGFEEESWRAYCALQAQGIQSLRARADKFIAEILAAQAPQVQAQAAAPHLGAPGGFHHTNNAQPYPPTAPREQSRYYKTQLCQGYLTGQCTRPNCNFAHGQHELRAFPTERHIGGPPAHTQHNVSLPPPVPIPSVNMSMPPHMPMAMPPPMPSLGMAPRAAAGEGVLSAPPAFIAPAPAQVQVVASAPASVPKGPAGFRMVPAQKRDREKSPDVTY